LKIDLLRQFPAEQVPVEAWPFVCGAHVAGRTGAVAFADGVLSIIVPSRQWSSELSQLSSRYVEHLNRLCPQKVVALRFVVANRD
jgi:hypothetical protein